MNKTYLRLENFQDQKIANSLNALIKAALRRCETLGHCLFIGNNGTWLAIAVAHELGSNLHAKNAGELNAGSFKEFNSLAHTLTNLEQGDVLLIKNIHELQPGIAEALCRAMKEFKCSVIIGNGKYQRTITIDLPSFTVIGTTSRPDLVLHDSFSVFQLGENL